MFIKTCCFMSHHVVPCHFMSHVMMFECFLFHDESCDIVCFQFMMSAAVILPFVGMYYCVRDVRTNRANTHNNKV